MGSWRPSSSTWDFSIRRATWIIHSMSPLGNVIGRPQFTRRDPLHPPPHPLQGCLSPLLQSPLAEVWDLAADFFQPTMSFRILFSSWSHPRSASLARLHLPIIRVISETAESAFSLLALKPLVTLCIGRQGLLQLFPWHIISYIQFPVVRFGILRLSRFRCLLCCLLRAMLGLLLSFHWLLSFLRIHLPARFFFSFRTARVEGTDDRRSSSSLAALSERASLDWRGGSRELAGT